MKKRLFATLFLCIALVFTLSGTALADDTVEYDSPEVGISFSMPSDFKILSRDSYKTDPVADALPYPQDNLDEWFDGDFYFIGTSDAAYCIFPYAPIRTVMTALFPSSKMGSWTLLRTLSQTASPRMVVRF